MTPEQQAQYESDRAAADATYRRLMMETNAIVTRARIPPKPLAPQSWWRRLFRLNSTHGVEVSRNG
jgi:hypothetical protein